MPLATDSWMTSTRIQISVVQHIHGTAVIGLAVDTLPNLIALWLSTVIFFLKKQKQMVSYCQAARLDIVEAKEGLVGEKVPIMQDYSSCAPSTWHIQALWAICLRTD